MNDEELIKKLREAFKVEARERLASMSSEMLKLEKTLEPNEQEPILEVVFREAHSMKGAARAVNLKDIENIFQLMESVFSAIKNEQIPLSTELFDILHYTIGTIEDFLEAFDQDQSLCNNEKTMSLIQQLEDLKNGDGKKEKIEEEEKRECPEKNQPEDTKEEKQTNNDQEIQNNRIEKKGRTESEKSFREISVTSSKPLISETIRISTSRLDSLLLQAEEMVSTKLVLSQHLTNLRNVLLLLAHWKKKYSNIDSELRSLRNQLPKKSHFEIKGSNKALLTKLLEFLEWNYEYTLSLGQEIKTLTKAAKQDHRLLSRMVDDLLEDMKKVMMLPFSTLLEIFPRMVRDISRNQGKEVELVIQGGEVEIDRRILEEMKDPLIHLLRNSLDHGLEGPQKRIEVQKPEKGTIKLSISQNDSSKIDILISDDGRGIDIKQVKEKALKLGIISKKEAEYLKDREALQLIFRSELSTSSIITQISGRGLGLAIAREKVEKLGGLLSVETTPGMGTSFRIHLPVTLASFRGVLLKVAGNFFIVPSTNMECALRIQPDKIKTVEGKATILLNGRVLSFVDLVHVLGLYRDKDQPKKKTFMTAVVLGTGEKRVAFKVDEILSEQEVLVKSLGKQLSRIPNIAGATVLGTGKAVPILNVQDLLKSSLEIAVGVSTPVIAANNNEKNERKKSILIVEDSITSRMLIKNILEGAGYNVKTAVDGHDAYTMLKIQSFDIVVSDVEMPRMDGFELTGKIRKDKKLAEIPVVLVTSLGSPEDQEKGIDAGANAYIVKSNFDQSNLLEVIGRLV